MTKDYKKVKYLTEKRGHANERLFYLHHQLTEVLKGLKTDTKGLMELKNVQN